MQANRVELSEIQRKVELYLSVNRFDAAEKLLKATLSDYGGLANIYNLLGVTYHRQSRFVDAVKQFHASLKANPDYVEAALNLVVTLCDLSRYEEAQQIHHGIREKIVPSKKQPQLVLGRLANQHANNGLAYQESGMHIEAIHEYKKALSLLDTMPDVRMNLAKLYAKVGQLEKARTEFEELSKLNPDLADPLNWLGVLFFKLGRRDEARQCWEKAQQIEPDNSITRAYIGMSASWSSRTIPHAP